MPQAFDECSSFRFGKTIDRVHEVYVRPPAFQERDEVFAQRLVGISRFVFLFRGPLVFFLHESFLFLPGEATSATSQEPSAGSFSRTRQSRTSSHICKKLQVSPESVPASRKPPILRFRYHKLYTRSVLRHFSLRPNRLPESHSAGILSFPRNSQEAIDET
jgi:hypothetical protein